MALPLKYGALDNLNIENQLPTLYQSGSACCPILSVYVTGPEVGSLCVG